MPVPSPECPDRPPCRVPAAANPPAKSSESPEISSDMRSAFPPPPPHRRSGTARCAPCNPRCLSAAFQSAFRRPVAIPPAVPRQSPFPDPPPTPPAARPTTAPPSSDPSLAAAAAPASSADTSAAVLRAAAACRRSQSPEYSPPSPCRCRESPAVFWDRWQWCSAERSTTRPPPRPAGTTGCERDRPR